ncbi:MAG: hypothetical protein A2919_01320 [Candidatus Spechtbacteria bacterium RIFCSPLOWO2_01_FULL_43_12]|uniref:Haloacid dehalogenase n=1 Tax=Candidatus Spechtbacteria bacterium RIFCSPLOWO2_01_FULL_43_12 TaxID=1802162 RepID=A0A1G2HE94_9BACT|nr:MAG: hypothetical protein A2919_01320 [Candidatus Spechtbacteria bacterium RIFCSPLOWO2_01_FULL_43_12]
MGKKVFIFDLDDTLMWTEHAYSRAFISFYNYLMNLWGNRIPYIGSVASSAEEITSKMVKEINPSTGRPWGFNMERFPTSLVRQYKDLCERGFGEYNKSSARDIYEIGLRAFRPNHYKLVPGVWRTLFYLYFKKCGLVLVTKGDKRVQKPKIKALKLRAWFEYRNIIIVDSKTPELFKDIMSKEEFTGSEFFSVGNSFYSDIEPAVQAGARGVYIPCYTWKVEEVPDSYDKSDIITLDKIADIVLAYEKGLFETA